MLPGYGFQSTEGGEPITTSAPLQPTSGNGGFEAGMTNPYFGEASILKESTAINRVLCVGCPKAGGVSGPNLFRTRLTTRQFFDEVLQEGNGMPSFYELLDPDQILKVHELVVSRDRL